MKSRESDPRLTGAAICLAVGVLLAAIFNGWWLLFPFGLALLGLWLLRG